MISRTIKLFRRIFWKLRWKLRKTPWVIRNWHNGYVITIPFSGSAAQIYYRKYSEPGLAAWMGKQLQAGDCFVDIGAHVGEYSLIAASAVGPTGKLVALEPQKDLCEIIEKNFRHNGIKNHRVVHGALGEHCGQCHLFTDDRNKGAVLDLHSPEANTPMYDLASLLGDTDGNGEIWMKLDAAGYELPCLMASQDYLKKHPIHLILKAYNAQVVHNRFSQIKSSLFEFLKSRDYRCFRLIDGVPTPWDGIVQGYCEAILCEPPNSNRFTSDV